jgi:hypothetical protein
MTGWLDLPWADLPPSVRVDVLGILAQNKPAIRIPVGERRTAAQVARVVAAVGWSHANDEDFLVAASSPEVASHVLDVDRSAQPHTLDLGLLLGYPACCARAAAHVGEGNIDQLAVRLGTDCERERAPHLDPRHYAKGIALVSYVACSPRCPTALQHAWASIRYINASVEGAAVQKEPWLTWHKTVEALHTHTLVGPFYRSPDQASRREPCVHPSIRTKMGA